MNENQFKIIINEWLENDMNEKFKKQVIRVGLETLKKDISNEIKVLSFQKFLIGIFAGYILGNLIPLVRKKNKVFNEEQKKEIKNEN